MNNTKRNLELSATIISTIVCSIGFILFSLTYLTLLQSGNKSYITVPSGMTYNEYVNKLKPFLHLFLIVFGGNLIFSISLLPSPIKNGVMRNRLISSVFYLVFTGILGILFIFSYPYLSLLIWLPFGLELASVCLKHPTYEKSENTEDLNLDEFNF